MKVIFDLEKDDFHKLECMQEAVNKRLGITPSIILPMEEAVLLGIINGLNAQFGISIPVEGIFEEAKKRNIKNVKHTLIQLQKAGVIFKRKKGWMEII